MDTAHPPRASHNWGRSERERRVVGTVSRVRPKPGWDRSRSSRQGGEKGEKEQGRTQKRGEKEETEKEWSGEQVASLEGQGQGTRRGGSVPAPGQPASRRPSELTCQA